MELNGHPVTPDELKVLALTNYGHFTTMLVDQGRVRGLSLHMERLTRDCRRLFHTSLDTGRVRELVRGMLDGRADATVVRITVFDPGLNLGNIGSDAEPHILVTERLAPESAAPPLNLRAVSYRREFPEIKHIGLFGSLKQRREAQREGFDDVLFLNGDGTISEIATSNIGFVRGDEIIWPRSEWLAGVTMTLINQALDAPVGLEQVRLSDLSEMTAVFATNAATAIRPVASVDGKTWPVDVKKLTELSSLYLDIPGELL